MARYLGIDIGHSAVRIVLLRTTYRRVIFERADEIPLHDTVSAAEAIQQFATQLGTSYDAVAVGLSGEDVFWRCMEIPVAAQRQLANLVPFELEAQVPFDLEQMVFDYRVLTRIGASLPLLVAVAHEDKVRAVIELVRSSLGAEPEMIVPGAFALASLVPWVAELEEPGPLLLVDLGAARTEVIILVGGEAVFARTLSAGTLGLPASAAMLARELRLTLGAWRATGGATATQLYLVGGGSEVDGAMAFLEGELGIPVRPLPPLRMEGLEPDRSTTLHRYAKALALALAPLSRTRLVNLRRGALAYERGYGFLRERIPVLAGLGTVLAVSLLFSVWAEMRALSKEHELLENTLGLVSKTILGEELKDPARVTDVLDKDPTEEDPLPRVDAFDVIAQLTQALPDGTHHDLEELDVQHPSPQAPSHVSIHGIVPKVQDAEAIATSLKEFRCFQDVKITKISQHIGGEGQKYHLELDARCPDNKKPKSLATAASAAAAASAAKDPK